MHLVSDTSWTTHGLSLLWSAEALFRFIRPHEAVSIRQFFALSRAWPEDLPSCVGNTLVVAGLDGCVDTLVPADAESWLDQDLRPRLLSFQDEYEGQAGLILWLPAGKQRIHMKPATEEYFWRCAPPFNDQNLAIGRILWAGAEADARRILDAGEKNQDSEGPAWIGLHHPRIS